jgi:GT2 family glycosyltransferase
MKNNFTAVMPVWVNDPELLMMTQASIDCYKSLGAKLIIVDNGSTIGGSVFRKGADIYIRNQKNLGYGPAMNQGLKLCQSEFIVLAENDTLASPNALKTALDIFSDPLIGSVHFRMLDYNADFSYGEDTWLHGKERWCTIAFCAIRRLAMPIGFFDENYITANYEDWQLIHDIRHILGWKTAYTNKACYKHRDGFTQKKLDQEVRKKEAHENREYFKRRNGNYPEDIWYALYPEQMRSPYLPYP